MAHGGGHRESYVEVLASVTGLQTLIASRRWSVIGRLVGAHRVLFASLEDDLVTFFLVAFLRLLLVRRTVAVVMNPGRVLEGGEWKHWLKGVALKTLKHMPGLTTLSIIPFYIDDRLPALTNDWIYDPQFWDMEVATGHVDDVSLAETVMTYAAGRPVLLFLGAFSKIKGFTFLADLMDQDRRIGERYLVVAAGKPEAATAAAAQKLRAAGGVVVDRYLTDAEVLSIKRAARVIWACYDPGYNSSSGLFGRALQLRKAVVVRHGSYLEIMALALKYPVIAIAYGDVRAAADMLVNMAGEGQDPPLHIGSHCAALSIPKLRKALS